jgi:hypothetical protein
MSWADFMDTKSFGDGIYRPYADFMGDLETQVDNLLGADPLFARFTKPLTGRDFVFVRGTRTAILCLSSDAHRHYPFRTCPEWKDFFRIPEEEFIAHHHGIDSTAAVVQRVDLASYLTGSLNFITPLSIGFPAIFIANRESAESQTRQVAVNVAAQLVVAADRVLYEAHLEMQKPKDIFLSHKSPDKTLVREVASTLRSVGLAPWLDEDRMKAGANLERALRQGFHDSCAAVFFVTPRFVDDGYLASEIDYALAEKRAKGDRFSIITLLIPGDDGTFGEVPNLLRTYVWKQIQPVEVVRTVVEALPIQCGTPTWRA